MAYGPSSTEQIHDPHFEQMVDSLCRHPGMYVNPPTYGSVCAYLDGFDAAKSGGPFMGLREWLVVRRNDGNCLWWSALARSLMPDGEATSEEQAIVELGHILSEFLQYRRTQGLTKIFHEYAKWLLRRSWYDGPLRQRRDQVDN
jgi:hypothetical protein